ncbi:hypothetical protein RHGRI_007112 [Rhododendron griersonianum]|uniref:Uncharacterized protein n=1 Tax=Rhododendron griersonianum TaxID=479676 RepID=A0AAV6KVV6_9ERIC|nr:hypothetical protein RHGRI_007112 [Rhododendron griersonianum]
MFGEEPKSLELLDWWWWWWWRRCGGGNGDGDVVVVAVVVVVVEWWWRCCGDGGMVTAAAVAVAWWWWCTAESSSYAPLPYTALPPLSLDLNLAYLSGGGCYGGVGFTGFIPTACPLFFFDKLLCSEALHNRLNMYRFDRKVSDLHFPVAGGVHNDSASVVPDPRSAVCGDGAVSGDDVGCCSRFRVGTGSWSLT